MKRECQVEGTSESLEDPQVHGLTSVSLGVLRAQGNPQDEKGMSQYTWVEDLEVKGIFS